MALAEFIVTFREFFEIAMVLGIMLAYLGKTGNGKFAKYVYLGAALAALASIVPVLAFDSFAETFEQSEALFEGVTLVVASGLVTWLIIWMLRQRSIAESLRQGLKVKVEDGQALGIVLFAFIAVFREGIEIVIFLGGIGISTGSVNAVGAVAGAVAALALAYAVFRSIIRLDFDKFFKVTGVLLILLAAGLLSQGVHELEEAGVLPPIIEHIYNFTPAVPPAADGAQVEYPLMHERGLAGGVLKGMVGYDTSPSLLQALAYVGYLLLAYVAFWKTAGDASNSRLREGKRE